MEQPILYEENETYGTLYLNRPTKHNAVSIEMAKMMNNQLMELKEKEISFLLIKAKGKKSFCSGGDLHDFHGKLSEEGITEQLQIMRDVLTQLIMFPVPTICLLQGSAFGGGCELATACDIRIAKEGTKFGFVQANLGILPGWGGGAILSEKVNSSFALQWILEGNTYDAQFLLEKGWLHHVIVEDNWVNEKQYLMPYKTKTLLQMRHLKSQFMESLQIPTLIEKMDKELARCAELWGSERHQQQVDEFLKNKNI